MIGFPTYEQLYQQWSEWYSPVGNKRKTLAHSVHSWFVTAGKHVALLIVFTQQILVKLEYQQYIYNIQKYRHPHESIIR